MELTVADVAEQYGRSERFVQQAIGRGHLAAHRRLGRRVVIDDIAARAWARALGRGRPWSTDTAQAAFDLLEVGETPLLGSSERSRLRARLRTMSAHEIAHAMGGLGSWARYRGERPSGATPIGPSATTSHHLGLIEGDDWLSFISTVDLNAFELDHDVVLDPDGNLGVVEREHPDGRETRILIDTYLLGDARQSAAAASALQERAKR